MCKCKCWSSTDKGRGVCLLVSMLAQLLNISLVSGLLWGEGKERALYPLFVHMFNQDNIPSSYVHDCIIRYGWCSVSAIASDSCTDEAHGIQHKITLYCLHKQWISGSFFPLPPPEPGYEANVHQLLVHMVYSVCR